MKKLQLEATLVAAAAAVVFTAQANAQSADALINKLVDKGILTVQEAKELREETDKDATKAYAVKSGLPDWVSALKFNGDFRGRFEQHDSDNPAFIQRNRFRYRARFGVTASLLDDVEIGFRLASANPAGGFGGNPLSANTDFSDNGARKFVWFDAAYAKWRAINNGDWLVSAIIGKMDNPFALSGMVFDLDYQPEGAALQVTRTLSDKHALKFTGAGFVLDEFNQGAAASHDPYVFGGQLLWEAKWSANWESSLTVAAFGFGNRDNLLNDKIPNVNDGNTRGPGTNGPPAHAFSPVIAGASMTYKLEHFPFYKAPFPIKLAGEYLNNPAAPAYNEGWWAGLTLGKAGHKGLWELAYKYEQLEPDANFEELADDDFGAFYQVGLANSSNGAGYRGGTNVRGHVVRLTYNLTDATSLAFTYYLTELIMASPAGSVSASSHWMFDVMWRF